MTRGRKPITGRYATRAELEEMVRLLSRTQNDARVCRVSPAVVGKILRVSPNSA